RLEAKVVDAEGASVGLNLTRASLDAACKYPWARTPGNRKFGVYGDDRLVFDWLRSGVPASGDEGRPRRCLEAQVMDWADDVACSVHDAEDGVSRNHIRLALPMADADERAALCRDVAEVYSALTPEELGEVLAGLLAEPALRAVADFDGSARALVALKSA